MSQVASLRHVEETIDRYIFKLKEPIILAILGGWGEGKTWFWKNRILPTHLDHRSGYVSVFGADSISVIRERVLIAALESIEQEKEGLVAAITKKLAWIKHLVTSISGFLKWGSGSIGIPNSVIDRLIEKVSLHQGWVLCIDDVERLSEKIGIDVFLGYANELREEYKLKVVLIFNNKWYEKQDNDIFRRYREKVIDREVPFTPNVKEIVLVVTQNNPSFDDDQADIIERLCNLLELRNIRILGKALRYFEEVLSALPENPNRLFCDEALHSLLLFSWIKFAAQSRLKFNDLPDYSETKRMAARYAQSGNDVVVDDVEKLLSDYGYTSTSDVDRVLMDFVQNGVLQSEKLIIEYHQFDNKASRAALEERFRDVWHVYFHGTFGSNEADLAAAFVEAVRQYMEFISVVELDGVLSILHDLGDTDKADSLLEEFLQQRPNFYQEYRVNSFLSGPPGYPPLKSVIDEAAKIQTQDDRTFLEVLDNVYDTGHTNEKNLKRLSHFSGENIANVLLNAEEPKLTGKLRYLHQRVEQPVSDEEKTIKCSLAESIQIIASRSALNRMRLETMGLVTRDNDGTK